jgi:alcohol dehydrogenase (cytochrome c)
VRTIFAVATAGTVALGLAARGLLATAQGSGQPAALPIARTLQSYKPVTAERLKKPEDGDWLMVRRTYDGWGYSPLGEITPDNVRRMQPVWVFATGVTNGHEAAPIVNNGVMFVARPPLALPETTARGRDPAPPDQPRRRALGRQGVFRGR